MTFFINQATLRNLLLAGVALLVIATSCKEEKNQSEVDRETILKYISEHNLNALSTASGLYYVMEDEGSGKRPSIKSDVQVIYKGYLTNGKVFDENKSGLWLNLSQVIEGWQEGIPLFMEGGKGKLLIPSKLGYGQSATRNIPANSVLIFDITLKDVR